MIDRETVIWAYRLILGREPESEQSITFHQQHKDSLSLRKSLLESDEFRQLQPGTRLPQEPVAFPNWNAVHVPKVVFLHCPKTGGTTLHDLLRQAFADEQVCPERFNGLKNMPAGQLLQYRFFSGHYDLVSCQLIPGEKRIITFLREPVARLLSLYNFLRAHRPEVVERNEWALARLAIQLDAVAFFRHPSVRMHPYLNNGMTRTLVDNLPIEVWPVVAQDLVLTDISAKADIALKRLQEMTAFGLLEHYDVSVRSIFTSLDLTVPNSIQKKMVLNDITGDPGNYRITERAQLTPQLATVLEELVSTDRHLYLHAQMLFSQRNSTAQA
ncbi:MAG: hypothetical protein ABWY06_25570 [Pseudomonas sp.]|uniref:hypothetical protein n=1 Tax=Pseudomonas sp. TaxID=306 RepID=UPI0033941F1A